MLYLGRTVVTNLADYHVDGYTHVGSSPSSSQFIAGTTSALTLTNTGVEDEQALSVYFNGLHQQHNTYTISNSVVTFDAAIPTGTDKVEIHYGTQPVTSGLAADSVDSNQLVNGSIDTAHIGDDQVTLAKLASGTDGELLTWDASGNPAAVGAGSSGHFLKSQGAGSVPVFAEVATASLTRLTEQATTSGTTKDFTIPSGATEVHLIWETGSTTGTISPMLVQLGDSGGIETSGYDGSVGWIDGSVAVKTTSSSGLSLCYMSNTLTLTAFMSLFLYDPSSYQWVAKVISQSDGNRPGCGLSTKTLTAELTTLRLMNGTFDAGSVNVWHNA